MIVVVGKMKRFYEFNDACLVFLGSGKVSSEDEQNDFVMVGLEFVKIGFE